MANFTSALPLLLRHEGGYAFVAGDPGGETYAGITRRNYPEWAGWRAIDAAKPLAHGATIGGAALAQAVAGFYQTAFWDRQHLGQLSSQRVAAFVLDWYVNCGAAAIKATQRAVGAVPDGSIGPASIAAINAADETTLMQHLIDARKDYYHALVQHNAALTRFLPGWLARVHDYE